MRRLRIVGLAVVVCVLVFGCGQREEAPEVLEKAAAAAVTTFDALLPQDTVVLLYKPDMARYRERFKESAMHAMWTDPNLTSWKQNFFLPNWAKLKELVGFDLDEFFGLFQKDVALVIEIPAQMTAEYTVPMIYARFGENTEKAKTFLSTAVIGALKKHVPDLQVTDEAVEGHTITRTNLGGGIEFAYLFLDDLWVLGPSVDRVAQVIKRQKQTEANWTSSAGYASARGMSDPAADTYIWVNLARATQWAKQLIALVGTEELTRNSRDMLMMQQLLDPLGLFDMEYLAATSTLKGKGAYSLMKLTFAVPRRGLFGLLKPTDELKTIKMLPPTTQSYSAISVKSMSDVLVLIKAIGNSVAPEEFPAGLKQASAQIKEELGFGVDEICAMIGSEHAFAVEQGVPFPFMALLIQLRDTAKFNQLLDKIIEQAGLMTQPGEYSGIAYKMFMIPMVPVQVCVATFEEYLVVTSGVSQLQRIIDAKTSGKYIEPVAEFQELKLAGNLIGQSCSKPADFSQMQPVVLMILQGINVKLQQQGMQPIPMKSIPNLAAISNHMLPSVSRSKAEEKAIISESYSVGAEKLIAAGVGGVMAAIAVPNFLQAQGRASVMRVKADQRSLATALEAYGIDHNRYPMWELRTDFATQRPTFILPSEETGRGGLTSPIAYITSIPRDPFSAGKKEWLSYYTSGRAWILISAGPDKDYDIVPQQDFQQPRDSKALWDIIVNKTYDPTNGSVSNGDVWRSNISH